MIDFEAGRKIAFTIWRKWACRLDLDDLKAQSALLMLNGKQGAELHFDLFDYAEKEYRRRPIQFPKHDPSYRWRPACCFVRRAVDQLPLRQSKVVKLVYFEDYLRVEAAMEMGVTKGEVTHLMHKAFDKLREQFGAAA